MEVGTIERDDATNLLEESDNAIESIEAHTYTHESGLTMSATIEEMGRCAVLGTYPPEVRAVLARAHIEGQRLRAEKEKEAEEAEIEKTEAKEETENKEDKIKQEAEVKEPDKSTNNATQEIVAAKQEPQRIEQSLAPEDSTDETGTAEVISSDVEFGANDLPKDVAALIPGTTIASPLEKIPAAETTPQEVQPTKNPQEVGSQQSPSGSSRTLESKTSGSTRIATEEAPAIPRISAEISTELQPEKQALEPIKINIVADVDTEERSLQLKEELQTDEPYVRLSPEAETSIDDAEMNLDAIQNVSELEPQHQANEQHELPKEFIEPGVVQEPIFDDLTIPPDQEAPIFNMHEHTDNNPEIINGLSVPVEEVEQTILQIADRLQQLEPEENNTAHPILNEIAQKVAEAQSSMAQDSESLEAATKTEDLEEDLKELFIQLFDQVETEYSLELIESCVKLALQGDIVEAIAKIKPEDEENNTSQGVGTHEVIKQLLVAISSVKGSARHACQIGKSALHLYFQGLLLLDLKLHPAYETTIY